MNIPSKIKIIILFIVIPGLLLSQVGVLKIKSYKGCYRQYNKTISLDAPAPDSGQSVIYQSWDINPPIDYWLVVSDLGESYDNELKYDWGRIEYEEVINQETNQLEWIFPNDYYEEILEINGGQYYSSTENMNCFVYECENGLPDYNTKKGVYFVDTYFEDENGNANCKTRTFYPETPEEYQFSDELYINEKHKTIQVFPNPSNGYVNYICDSDTRINVFDINGRKAPVKNIPESQVLIFDPALKDGIYIIQFISKDSVKSKLIMLEK